MTNEKLKYVLEITDERILNYFFLAFKPVLPSSQQDIQNITSDERRSIKIANTDYELLLHYSENDEYQIAVYLEDMLCFEAFANCESFTLLYLTFDKKSCEIIGTENNFGKEVIYLEIGFSFIIIYDNNENVISACTKINSQKNGFGCLYKGGCLEYIGFFKDDKRYGFGISFDNENDILRNDLWISVQDESRVSIENPIEIDISHYSLVAKEIKQLFISSVTLQSPMFTVSSFPKLKKLVICEKCCWNTGSPCKKLYINNKSIESIIIKARSLLSIEEMIVEDCPKLKRIEIGVPNEDNSNGKLCLENCQLFKFQNLEQLMEIVIHDEVSSSIQCMILENLENLESISVGNDSLCNKDGSINGYSLYLINIQNLQPIEYNYYTSLQKCSSIFYSNVNNTALFSLRNISTLQSILPLESSQDNQYIYTVQPNPIHYINNEEEVMLLNSYINDLQIWSLLRYDIRISDSSSIPVKIEIGENICFSFENLNGLSDPQSLNIHNNLVSISRIRYYDNPVSINSTFESSNLQNLRVFSINTNCNKLCSQFHLNNCPLLESISIGNMGNNSSSDHTFLCTQNFYYDQFDLPKLESITIGYYCFENVTVCCLNNLPSLRNVVIKKSFYGNMFNNCYLSLICLPVLFMFDTDEESFMYYKEVYIDNVPNYPSFRGLRKYNIIVC